MNSDITLRAQALQPDQSFIIQAPAGSGKTELLVQRFLVLLARIEQAPEEIIALTFTRKAANEMRQRILLALQAARNPEPSEAHKQQTWRLANAVLQQDRLRHWHLLQNPNRLRVLTLDALCSSLVRRMPISSGFGAMPQSIEDAKDFYLEATRRLLMMLTDSASVEARALTQLLLHLDNRVADVEKLIMNMLARRDQWLPHIIAHRQYNSEVMRTTLERGLRAIVMEALQNCYARTPKELHAEIATLTRFAVSNISEGSLAEDYSLDTFPEPHLEKLPIFLTMSQLLFTNEHQWRCAVDKRIGFPANNKAMKARMIALIKQLSSVAGLRQSWQALREAPTCQYTENQWLIVAALMQLLPLAVAQLTLLFQERGGVDFIETALAAQRALGEDCLPSDLALKLDYQIQHILVDEFQDTSINQYRLLEQLTRGWQEGDGRTLFLVGDPMQSIYRFRAAEVGLFLKAQQEGLGQIALTPLRLTNNFRATANVVHWINTHFTPLFPDDTDIYAGAVPFHESIATHETDGDSAVHLHPLSHSVDMGERVREIVQQRLAKQPTASIAILVRSRSKLIDILPVLKKAGLAFHAVEIESLSKQSIVRDLLALTRALFHMGDRIAWLSILRAPWCGLTLTDLHTLSRGSPLLWQNIQHYQNLHLSPDGRRRVAHVLSALQPALRQNQRSALRPWIEQTWRALRGPDCLLEKSDYSAANAYFELLEEFDMRGQWPDVGLLEQQVNERYATVEAADTATLQVMTIHKAKGLEFDTVIIPHMESVGRSEAEQLLLWLERPRRNQGADLLLAPVKAKKEEYDPIYRYLLNIENKKRQLEMTRLLYVAATRAKTNLHLLGFVHSQNEQVKPPSAQSFMGMLWPVFQKVIEKEGVESNTICEDVVPLSTTAIWKRLILSEQSLNVEFSMESGIFQKSHSFKELDIINTAIGTVVHRCLQKISSEDLCAWHLERLQQEQPYWRKWLLQCGVPAEMCANCLDYVKKVIQKTLQDPRGRWLLHPHREAQSEFALTTVRFGQLVHLVIDRTFVDTQQVRWIIDYKTEPSVFLHQEIRENKLTLNEIQNKYGMQMEKYAYAISQIDQRKIKLGIYFPEQGHWYEWDWAASESCVAAAVQ